MALQLDANILGAALQGLDLQKARINAQIADVKARLGRPHTGKAVSAVKAITMKPRTMSAEARKRIAEAQRKRWAAYHKEKAAG